MVVVISGINYRCVISYWRASLSPLAGRLFRGKGH